MGPRGRKSVGLCLWRLYQVSVSFSLPVYHEVNSLLHGPILPLHPVRTFLVQGQLGNLEPRKHKSHHATNLTWEIYWGETQNGSSLWAGTGTAEDWVEGRASIGLLEHAQSLMMSHEGRHFQVRRFMSTQDQCAFPLALAYKLGVKSGSQCSFLGPFSLCSSIFCLLLISNQGLGNRVALSLNYFLLYGGIEVHGASLILTIWVQPGVKGPWNNKWLKIWLGIIWTCCWRNLERSL